MNQKYLIKRVTARRVIDAPAEQIFDLLACPAKHHTFDGSNTVKSSPASSTDRLQLGSRFSMNMRLFVPYRMSNEVVEFEQSRLIAWRHLGHHLWRYELRKVDATTTEVAESFDWANARFPSKIYELVNYPARNLANIEKTLERLANVVEAN